MSELKASTNISYTAGNIVFINTIGRLNNATSNGKLNISNLGNINLGVIGRVDSIVPLLGSSYYVNLFGRLDKTISIRASSDVLASNNIGKASNAT
jgi:hypothetical protein